VPLYVAPVLDVEQRRAWRVVSVSFEHPEHGVVEEVLSISGSRRYNDTAIELFVQPGSDEQRTIRIINGVASLRTPHGDLGLCAASVRCAAFTVGEDDVESLTERADAALVAAGFPLPTGRRLQAKCETSLPSPPPPSPPSPPWSPPLPPESGSGSEEGSGWDPPLIQVTVEDETALKNALRNETVEKIVIAAKTYKLSGELEITRSVILVAAEPGSVVLDGRDYTKVIYIDVPANVSVELIGLNITRGSSSSWGGGGVYVSNGQVTFTSTNIYGNTASIGGGVMIWNGVVNFNNCQIYNNKAGDGDNVYNVGGTVCAAPMIVQGVVGLIDPCASP